MIISIHTYNNTYMRYIKYFINDLTRRKSGNTWQHILRKGTIVKEYRVKWEIDVTASSPEEATKEAFKMMQIPTTATVFEVREYGNDEPVEINLLNNPVTLEKKL